MSATVQITCEDLSFCQPGTIFTAKKDLKCSFVSDYPERKEIGFQLVTPKNKSLILRYRYYSTVMIDVDVYKSSILGYIKKMFQLDPNLKPQLWRGDPGTTCITFLEDEVAVESERIHIIINCNSAPFLEEGSTIDLWEV